MAAVPEAKLLSEEAREYRTRWERALQRAALRDYEGTSAVLERASREFKEAGVRREAAADAEVLRRILGLIGEATQLVARWERWEMLEVSLRDASGARTEVHGQVARADEARIEFKGDVFVECGEPLNRPVREAPETRWKAGGTCLPGSSAGRVRAVPGWSA